VCAVLWLRQWRRPGRAALPAWQAGHALGAVALVAGDALAHLVVPGWAVAMSSGAVLGRLRQPVARQQLGAARLAAFLATEDELAAADAGVRVMRPPRPAGAPPPAGLEGNQAWK
jgi:hypothetical protein